MIYKKNKLIIERIDIGAIAKKYKTPTYCYFLKKIRNNIQDLKNNFKISHAWFGDPGSVRTWN